MPGRLPLPVFLLLLATAAAASGAVPAAAVADRYSGRMVIVRAPGARLAAGTARGNRQHRRLEDEVAPEFGGLLGAGNGDDISYKTLNPGRSVCLPHKQCAAKGPGGSHTRPCTYKQDCPH